MRANPPAHDAAAIAEGKAAREPEGYRDDLRAFLKAVAPNAIARGAEPYTRASLAQSKGEE